MQNITDIIARHVRWPRPAAQRLADALLESLTVAKIDKTFDELSRILFEHDHSGSVNTREGWFECACGERLYPPRGLDSAGYAHEWEEERLVRAQHIARVILNLDLDKESTDNV